ncbi:MAG: Rieske 2Fe-2S domain-containing protein, partial [Chloroflexota bacterium]|nr:Rieske 2Fe-2S domain-containing protein [Chloroflexota bacterium]
VEGRCAHRRVELRFGIPEPEGLRCAYHGWLYSPEGQCLQMPDEPAGSTYPSRVSLQAYPVRELAGVVFAYLGPEPAPLLPNWDLFVMENVARDVGFQVLNCNWLQVQENDMDPAHLEWLHGYFSNYALERIGRPDLRRPWRGGGGEPRTPVGERRDWAVYDQGIMNYAKTPNGLREVRPSIFPNVNSFTTDFMYRVPMDDTHTLHVFFTSYAQDPEEPPQKSVPYYIVPPSVDAHGDPIWQELDNNGGQDAMAWLAQGPIVDRTKERLGESDRGVLMYRELLRQQLRIVEDGGEPINVVRDPAKNVCIPVPPRDGSPMVWDGPSEHLMNRVTGPYKHSPVVREMVKKHRGEEALEGPVH